MSNALIVKPLALGTVTAEGSGAGTLPAYLGNDFVGVVHRGTNGAAGWVQLDLASAQSLDFAAFLSTNLAPGATQRVRAATTAAGLTGVPGYDSGVINPAIAGSSIPTSGRSNSWWRDAAQSFRYWRFDLASLGGAAFEAGRLVVGQSIQLDRNFSFGAVRGVRDTSKLEWSALGVMLRRRGRKLRTLSISFENAYRDEVEQKILPLLEVAGASEPLLIVLDPDAHAERQNRMYFGPIVGDLGVIQRTASGYRWQAELVSLI